MRLAARVAMCLALGTATAAAPRLAAAGALASVQAQPLLADDAAVGTLQEQPLLATSFEGQQSCARPAFLTGDTVGEANPAALYANLCGA